MSRRHALHALCAAMVPLLAACASPDPSYFTLKPADGAVRPAAPVAVTVRRVALPGYLDRQELVRTDGAYDLRLSSDERWAEPFDDMIGRVLAQDLARRLPGATVVAEGSGLGAPGGSSLDVVLSRFDADAAGAVTLAAQVGVSRGRDMPPAVQEVELTAPAHGPGGAGVAAAMSEALGLLADRIAARLAP